MAKSGVIFWFNREIVAISPTVMVRYFGGVIVLIIGTEWSLQKRAKRIG